MFNETLNILTPSQFYSRSHFTSEETPTPVQCIKLPVKNFTHSARLKKSNNNNNERLWRYQNEERQRGNGCAGLRSYSNNFRSQRVTAMFSKTLVHDGSSIPCYIIIVQVHKDTERSSNEHGFS